MYTKAELAEKNKVLLRKIAREMGANMQETAKLTQSELVDWIVDNQEPEEKPAAGKKGKRGTPAPEPEPEPTRGRTAPPRRGPAAGKAAPEEAANEEAPPKKGASVGDVISAKLDTIGGVLDSLSSSLESLVALVTDNANENNADNYIIKGVLKKLCVRLEAEGLLSEDTADVEDAGPMADYAQKLEDETAGK